MFFPDITVRLKNSKKRTGIHHLFFYRRYHHSHTLCNLSTFCKNYFLQSPRWHLCQQIFAYTTLIDRFTSDIGFRVSPRNQLIKFELLTQSITRLTPQSAVAPPVRMGLTNLLVGNNRSFSIYCNEYLHENNFRIHVI